MSGIMSNFYIGMFGKKEEPKSAEKQSVPVEKPSEKPGPSLFSGLSMKKGPKPEVSVTSGYVPPLPDYPSKVLDTTYKPPEPEILKKNKTVNDYGSFESTENTRSNEDPFADIKIGEENKIQKKNQIPGFNDSDSDEESLNFVRKSKLQNLEQPIKKSNENFFSQTEKKSEGAFFAEKKIEGNPQIEKKNEGSPATEKKGFEVLKKTEETKVKEPKKTENIREENKFLKQLEEKKKKEQEEKERKELEEKLRIEALVQKEKEEKQRKELEDQRKIEEKVKILKQFEDSESLKESIKITLDDYSKSLFEKIHQQKDLKKAQKELLSSVESMQSQITRLEELENQAAMEEDFESAAKYNEELEDLKESCKLNHEHIQNNSAQYSLLENEKSVLLENKKI